MLFHTDIKDIINENLDEGLLNRHIFSHIAGQNENIYSSNSSKDAIKKYESNGNKENAKKLWKELLIDSICLLKINDKREKLYIDLQSKTANAFHEKFSKIRHRSSYGIDELDTYFDDFVEYESVLYGTGDYYRDHIHHVLQVWAIGIGLMFGKNPIHVKLNEDFTIDREALFHKDIEKKAEPISISQSELWAMWTIIALCHDLGYPLEKTSIINQKVKKIINHFGCISFNELNFNFDLLNSFIVEKYIDIVSSKVKRTICGEHRTEIQHKFRDKISKSLEDYKHGMFSGLLLFKKLVYFLETDYAPSDRALSDEDLRQFYIRKEILRAICAHTCPKIYHIELNTLSFLLILCDELQDWNRPRFEELIERSTSKNNVTNRINKFLTTDDSSECDIQIETKHNTISISNKPELLKHLVLSRFKNFNYLLRSAKDDTTRKIKFKWSIVFKDKTFHYDFVSENNAVDTPEIYSLSATSKSKKPRKVFVRLYQDK